jgi:hypothetical protein
MNDHITKPIDPAVLYQTLKAWIAEKQVAIQQQKPQTTSDVTATDDAVLPFLPGIDQEKALKVLNHNIHLFVKLLNMFKKSFSSLPALLRELSEAGKWTEIRDKAHPLP